MTVSEWGGDSGTRVPGADVIASGSAAVDPVQSASESGHDGSGDLRAEALKLARLLDPIAFDDRAKPQNLGQSFDRYSRQQTAMDHATIALIRGYRLVSEDETTVDRVARAMHLAGCECGMSFDDHQVSMLNDFGEEDEGYMVMARAAVRALREGGAS